MKIFGNFIFRMVVGAVVIIATVFCPLFLLLPKFSTENQIWLGVLVLLLAVLECILFIFWNYRWIIQPAKTMNDAARKVGNGEYNTRVKIKAADTQIKELSRNLNGMAGEFENSLSPTPRTSCVLR